MNDLSSWYALMQHHCAPTPLLDWTESPYVGMYFAAENQAKEKRPEDKEPHSAVWAIDSYWLEVRGRELLEEKDIEYSNNVSPTEVAEQTNRLIKETEAPCVIRINPSMSNPRLFAQRGLFLCKLIELASVGQLLMSMIMHPTLMCRPVIRRLEIANSFRFEFLKRLRTMNIHRASLKNRD